MEKKKGFSPETFYTRTHAFNSGTTLIPFKRASKRSSPPPKTPTRALSPYQPANAYNAGDTRNPRHHDGLSPGLAALINLKSEQKPRNKKKGNLSMQASSRNTTPSLIRGERSLSGER